jgi:Domain of unknown function (DUF4349)
MPDLEMLLRDLRPAPDPAWAARLDARVAARFPGPPPRWKRPLIALRDHLLAIGAVATAAVAAVAFVMVIASLPQAGDDEEAASGGSTPVMSAPEANSGGGASTAEEKSADSAQAPQATTAPAQPSRDRAVISAATLTLSTSPDRVETVTDRAIRVVDGLGGYVQTSEVSRSGSSASSTLSLRIPADKLDSGLAQLSKLAHVSSRSQQDQDVTDQREALEAAVRDARADREGLRARLAKATTDRERSRLRAQLDRATRRVTQRQRRVAELANAVSFATVDLNVEGNRRSGAAAPPGRWTPGDALDDAVRVLEVAAGVLLIALAVLLPIAVIAILAGLASRLLVRRRRERALEMA